MGHVVHGVKGGKCYQEALKGNRELVRTRHRWTYVIKMKLAYVAFEYEN